MQMVPVKSSNIKAVGFDHEADTLHIEFNNGTYVFKDVPPEAHRALMDAESVGSHFHKHIKGKYEPKAPEVPASE